MEAISLEDMMMRDADGFKRLLATNKSRQERNKRFNRNKRRIFKKAGAYKGYIAGETLFHKEMVTITLTNMF